MKFCFNYSINKKGLYQKIILVFTAVVLAVGLYYYCLIFGKAVLKNGVIYIGSEDNMENVSHYLSDFIKNPQYFSWLSEKKKFRRVKKGKYTLKKGMSINEVVNLLRSGKQTPVVVLFNNEDTLEKLAVRVSKQIEVDSVSLLKAMRDSAFLSAHGFTIKSALGMYIPNSYEFYWTSSAKNFRNRMLKEYKRFWNDNRVKQAESLNLSKQEVSTLASIVQKETAQKSERPIVAGLYLNRLKKGWPLQADPTVIYAKKLQNKNTNIERVLFKYIKETKNSPYNTYTNRGLPPSLICMPDISAIDAVLFAEKHNYYYMCASVDKIGFHVFTSSLAQHNRNAAKYHRWISKKKTNYHANTYAP
ncbi:MAG: endolytic transglycosylase MltG [Tenacibaculum sp.]